MVTQGTDEPERFLKLTHQRTPIESGGGNTRKGLREYFQELIGQQTGGISRVSSLAEAGTLEMKVNQKM